MAVTIQFKPRRAKTSLCIVHSALLHFRWIKNKTSISEGFLLLSNKVMHRKHDLPATKKFPL